VNRVRRLASSAPEKALERQAAQGWLPRGWIDGLTLSNDATDATNDIDIAVGVARSTSNRVNGLISTAAKDQRDIEIDATRVKQLDVVWAPGNGGGRSAESLVDATWHWLAIGGRGLKDDLIAVSSLASATVIHNALPSGYTAYRRTGSTIRASGALVGFSQMGDEFLLKAKSQNAYLAPGTSAVLRTLLVPVGVKMKAILTGYWLPVSSSASFIFLTSPDETDEASSASTSGFYAISSAVPAGFAKEVRTNTVAQIRVRTSHSAASDIYTLICGGWFDDRDRNS
jgi:hypothetical protein